MPNHLEGEREELEGEEAEARPFFRGGLLDLDDVYESDPEELLPLRAGRFPGERACTDPHESIPAEALERPGYISRGWTGCSLKVDAADLTPVESCLAPVKSCLMNRMDINIQPAEGVMDVAAGL